MKNKWTLRLTDGKTKEVFEVDTESCFCSFRTPLYIPPALADKKNTPFLGVVLAHFDGARLQPDPSLQWILYGLNHQMTLDDHPFFQQVIRFPNDWLTGKPELPMSYSLPVDPDDLGALPPVSTTDYEPWQKEPGAKYFLIYRGHNHYGPCGREASPFILLAESAEYKAWVTCHGIAVQKGDLHKWVFVTENGLTGSPSKLRFKSIGKIVLTGRYIILQHLIFDLDDEGNQVWVIDIEGGICAKFKGGEEGFKLNGGVLRIESEADTDFYGLENVLNALDALSKVASQKK